jgi:hypothetical protein
MRECLVFEVNAEFGLVLDEKLCCVWELLLLTPPLYGSYS